MCFNEYCYSYLQHDELHIACVVPAGCASFRNKSSIQAVTQRSQLNVAICENGLPTSFLFRLVEQEKNLSELHEEMRRAKAFTFSNCLYSRLLIVMCSMPLTHRVAYTGKDFTVEFVALMTDMPCAVRLGKDFFRALVTKVVSEKDYVDVSLQKYSSSSSISSINFRVINI